VYLMEQGETISFEVRTDSMPITVPGDSLFTRVILHRVFDPNLDPDPEMIRVRLYKIDANQGRQVIFEDTITQDMTAPESSPYGEPLAFIPDGEIELLQVENGLPAQYGVEISVLDGGPVSFARDLVDERGVVASDVSIGLQLLSDRTLTFIDLNFDAPPLLTGHGNDIPETPTHWTVGGSDLISFTAPVDGVIREIEIPHLGDPLKDADVETVRFVLTAPDGTTTAATVQDDFNADADPLGPARTVVFDPPLAVTKYNAAGETNVYTLTVEALDPVYTSGPVIAWEGSWDDPVPWAVCPLPDDMQYSDDLPSGLSSYTCGGISMYNSYYQGIQLWMAAEDNDQKYHAITNALDQADYFVITSNRFYDSLSRIPQRWPMTLAFYDALFAGDAGFELIKTFESHPELGPFYIRDQVLPTDDLPADVLDLLNEHWEVEEAFHVYDHPVVMVFRKTDDYTPEKLRAILNSVSLTSINEAGFAYLADPNPVGVIPWGAKEAGEAKNFQQLSATKWETQTEGGTWSELFDLASAINRSEVMAVIVWWLLMVFVGWITWPLLFVMFPALPDRGFPAAKITGWLIVAWLAWVGGTLNILTWTRPGLAILLVLLAALSLAFIWRRRAEYVQYISTHRLHILAMEALTLLLFGGFLWVRAGNPDLWHGSFGGEKPMDFAYFNGVLRSTVFPPLNPWASGEYINYYYFGYVIVGAPVKLIGLDPAVAYNLIIPTLYALTGIGVFSVAYNWVRSRATTPGVPHPPAPSPSTERGSQAGMSDVVGTGLQTRPHEAGIVHDDNPVGVILVAERQLPLAANTESREFTESAESGGAYIELTSVDAPLQHDPESLTVQSPPLHRIERGPGGEVSRMERAATEVAQRGEVAENRESRRLAGRLPHGSAWTAGLLALLLAMVLGNLGTFYVMFTNVAKLGGYERGLLYHQQRTQDLEAERTEIYADFYNEELEKFRDEHGREPDAGEANVITLDAQIKTDDYIDEQANHPPIYKLWAYELGNIRDQVGAFFDGLGKVIDGAELPMASHRWHWGPTRIISELPDNAGGGAIAEMPYFTFLY
ncbi:MAG: hypothetical protein JXA10_01530, partial [Anaerolineae bacterium]|nr:hypothetical protein [Anaerolineae bacterium]